MGVSSFWWLWMWSWLWIRVKHNEDRHQYASRFHWPPHHSTSRPHVISSVEPLPVRSWSDRARGGWLVLVRFSDVVFKIQHKFLGWYFDPITMYNLILWINLYQGDLTDVSAKTKTLVRFHWLLGYVQFWSTTLTLLLQCQGVTSPCAGCTMSFNCMNNPSDSLLLVVCNCAIAQNVTMHCRYVDDTSVLSH